MEKLEKYKEQNTKIWLQPKGKEKEKNWEKGKSNVALIRVESRRFIAISALAFLKKRVKKTAKRKQSFRG